MTLYPSELGIAGKGQVYRNMAVAALVQEAVRRGEGSLTATGALDVCTGKYTGRSPRDRFIVDSPAVHADIAWGEINQPLSPEAYAALKARVLAYLADRTLYVFDGYAGADPRYSQKFRIINESASQNLFMHQLLIRPEEEKLPGFSPDYTIISAPGFKCEAERDGVHSETAIIIDLEAHEILIAGNLYCGELKKSVFSVMNYVLPHMGVLPMHCSANIGADGDTAIFFGLSGTGKTTLSSVPERMLIGDDEHGWSGEGVFNIEGGCYAKCINLQQEAEPEIFNAIRFGAVLENVIINDEGVPDYCDATLTDNTRAGYPISYIPNATLRGSGGQPSTIIFLTADAFGVLPPISRLDTETALYHFVSGYTSKLAGTERGVTEPTATFSSMFGEPFFPMNAALYASMLRERLSESGARVFLVNTGWCGGHAGEAPRLKLKYTRAMVAAAMAGELEHVSYHRDAIFNVDIPDSCPNVPAELLDPQRMWSDGAKYLAEARALAGRFRENYLKKHPDMPASISEAGPRV